MVASRNKPEGGLPILSWLGVMMVLALPSEVGYQDLATLLTRQPVANRAQKTAFASTFGTIHEAPYNLPSWLARRSRFPPGYTLAGLDLLMNTARAAFRGYARALRKDTGGSP